MINGIKRRWEIQQNQDNSSLVINWKSNVVVYSDKGSFCIVVKVSRLEDSTKVIAIDLVGELRQ